jgi:membrane-bound PQQ-dependent dehydrogenase (glucose/quinate/shikimate family)
MLPTQRGDIRNEGGLMHQALGRAVVWIVSLAVLTASSSTIADEWSSYGRDSGGTRYSPLTQITPENVRKLQTVWTFHTGDLSPSTNGRRSGFETTPLVIGGRLFLTTSFNRVIALDPATGRQLWAYDPHLDKTLPFGDGFINRGLAAWRDSEKVSQGCGLRLFEATLDARLIALDAASGAPCRDFGKEGEVDLRDVPNYVPGWYHMTSPPVVLDGVVVVGSAIDDNTRAQMPDGVVRGYDARTGRLLWRWEPLERPAGIEPGAWKTGAANAWSALTADSRRHLVYVPTGSGSPDYYGGLRPGDNRWANSVVALNVKTGKLVWGFQLVHHDLWDYDTAAQPMLTSLTLHGKRTEVLVAGNKTGMLYVLDPATGKPVLPVEERPVPQSDIAGETTSPTQPFPVTLPSLARQSLSAQEAWGLTEADKNACRQEIQGMSGTRLFSPPSLQGTLAVPSHFGGINWSGFAWDAKHEHVIVGLTNLPGRVRLMPRDQFQGARRESFRGEVGSQEGTPYVMIRDVLRAPSGVPCGPPPWGELVSVDLAAGKIVWRKPLGSMDEVFPSAPKSAVGSLILGGSIVTAGGLIFAGGTLDRTFRALSADTGDEIWSTTLPASGHALPITYEVGGRQFVVIAAGGSPHIDEEQLADALVAFALP